MANSNASCPWVALDLETTGLSPTRHRIREAALVPFSDIAQEPGTVVRFPMQNEAAPLRRPIDRLRSLLAETPDGGLVLVHHAAFDLAFLAETLRRSASGPFELTAYCTLRLARTLLPHLACHDLNSLREELGLGHRPAHTALHDARAVASLFQLLSGRFGLVTESDVVAVHGAPIRVGRWTSTSIVKREVHGP
jgi:DNA polymerase III epsilon subunit-like protein